MLTYMQVHLYFLLPPIAVLAAVYRPLFGRRDALKILWLGFMATAYTTPWDNWILSQSGWSYPPGSILFKIHLVPFEEHLFFILQPILLILLHCLITHPRLVPFRIPKVAEAVRLTTRVTAATVTTGANGNGNGNGHDGVQLKSVNWVDERRQDVVQTLPKRKLAALAWMVPCAVGALMVNDAHQYLDISAQVERLPPALQALVCLAQQGQHGFYLGWILIWVTPVIAFLTYLGARMRSAEYKTLFIGVAWLHMVDTIAIRNGAWSISCETSLCFEVWRGLPVEEFLFFILTSYLVILSSALITHLHTLLLLCPSLPACPPANPIKHIAMLYRAAVATPRVDVRALQALVSAEETLRKGSKSFDVAKLAFGREMRIGLVAIYAWCRVTDNLMDDEPAVATGQTKREILAIIRQHLYAAFTYPIQINPDTVITQIEGLTVEERSAFHLFAQLIPRLVPIYPFLELCAGYETDLAFMPPPAASGPNSLAARMRDPAFAIERYLPIKTTADLLKYADDVAGSIASAICYLAWSSLESPSAVIPGTARRPVEYLDWAGGVHGDLLYDERNLTLLEQKRIHIVEKAREMGRALQLVNIARDVAKDAAIGRVYVPLASFSSARALLSILVPSTSAAPPDYAPLNLPLLDMADEMRRASAPAMAELPRTASGGTRAMVASYFEIAEEIRRRGGTVDDRGVKVDKGRRLKAAAAAMWLGAA